MTANWRISHCALRSQQQRDDGDMGPNSGAGETVNICSFAIKWSLGREGSDCTLGKDMRKIHYAVLERVLSDTESERPRSSKSLRLWLFIVIIIFIIIQVFGQIFKCTAFVRGHSCLPSQRLLIKPAGSAIFVRVSIARVSNRDRRRLPRCLK